jgi:hypothetical protein
MPVGISHQWCRAERCWLCCSISSAVEQAGQSILIGQLPSRVLPQVLHGRSICLSIEQYEVWVTDIECLLLADRP